jgi:hypothetical protein
MRIIARGLDSAIDLCGNERLLMSAGSENAGVERRGRGEQLVPLFALRPPQKWNTVRITLSKIVFGA